MTKDKAVLASQVQVEIFSIEVKVGRGFWRKASVAIGSGEWVIVSWITNSDASYGSVP